ncbi:MAG: hypothetical protein WD907_03350, partial [Bacilli bacterium]
MRDNSRFMIGFILIAIGIFALLSKLGWALFSWNLVWPIVLFGPGLMFHYAYFSRRIRNAGILVPGGILTTYGLLFFFCGLFGYHWMGTLWPFFIIGVAVGLFELYLFEGRNSGLLIPIFILSAIGITFL